MSELDVREVKLQLRYPESRQEDITDAYMRGCKSVMQVTDKLITRLNEENEKLKAENAKLHERAVAMLSELRGVVSEGDYDSPSGRYFLLRRDVAAYEDALRELGIEVE